MQIGIIKFTQMLCRNIISHQGVTNFPAVSVYKLPQRGVRDKLRQTLIGINFWQANNVYRMPLVNEQKLTSVQRMALDKTMPCDWRCRQLFWRKGCLGVTSAIRLSR